MLRVGDKVQIKPNHYTFAGSTGTVTNISTGTGNRFFSVVLDVSNHGFIFSADDLELIEQPQSPEVKDNINNIK